MKICRFSNSHFLSFAFRHHHHLSFFKQENHFIYSYWLCRIKRSGGGVNETFVFFRRIKYNFLKVEGAISIFQIWWPFFQIKYSIFAAKNAKFSKSGVYAPPAPYGRHIPGYVNNGIFYFWRTETHNSHFSFIFMFHFHFNLCGKNLIHFDIWNNCCFAIIYYVH